MFIDLVIGAMVHNLHDQGYNVDPVQLKCVAENVYFEARGESTIDQVYVANVTMNRVNDVQHRWGSTPCSVVNQPYQFSWTNDPIFVKIQEDEIGRSEHNMELWKRVVEVSGLVMTGMVTDQTGGANHYHRRDVKPRWTHDYAVTHIRTYSVHVFYTDKPAKKKTA